MTDFEASSGQSPDLRAELDELRRQVAAGEITPEQLVELLEQRPDLAQEEERRYIERGRDAA